MFGATSLLTVSSQVAPKERAHVVIRSGEAFVAGYRFCSARATFTLGLEPTLLAGDRVLLALPASAQLSRSTAPLAELLAVERGSRFVHAVDGQFAGFEELLVELRRLVE